MEDGLADLTPAGPWPPPRNETGKQMRLRVLSLGHMGLAAPGIHRGKHGFHTVAWAVHHRVLAWTARRPGMGSNDKGQLLSSPHARSGADDPGH